MDAIVYDKVGKEAEKVREALYGIYPQATITDAAIASFDDGADGMPVKKLVANIEPVQDLHGYDNPWPAGGGKNKLPIPTSAVTDHGITATPNADGTLTLTGTATETHAYIDLDVNFDSTLYAGYVVTGLPSTGSWNQNSVCIRVSSQNDRTAIQDVTRLNGTYGGTNDSNAIADNGSNLRISIRIAFGYACPSGGLTLNLMLRAPTESDVFQPYSNICPISGWTGTEVTRIGRNWLDISKFAERYPNYCTYSNDTLTVNNATGGLYSQGIDCFIPTGAILNASITLETAINVRFRLVHSDGTIIELSPSYLPHRLQKDVINVRFNWSEGGTFSVSNACALSVATVNEWEYIPYQGASLSVTFPSSAGTVYGGTLTINPDRTGTLVVDRKCVDLGDIAWNYNSEQARFLSQRTIADVKLPVNNNIPANMICSQYKNVSAFSNIDIDYTAAISMYGTIGVHDSSFNGDVQAFSASMSGVQLVYELATPITYTLTESEISAILTTLYGTNNIWADCGDIEKLAYRADLGKYIDSHITTAVANALNA